MSLAPEKQLLTIAFHFAAACDQLAAADALLQKLRAAVVAHGLGPALPPGAAVALSSFAADVHTLSQRPVIAQVRALVVPSHLGNALPGELS